MLCHQRVDDAWRALWPLDVTHARAKLSPMMPSKSKVDTSREQESTLKREKRKNAAESAFLLSTLRKSFPKKICYRFDYNCKIKGPILDGKTDKSVKDR